MMSICHYRSNLYRAGEKLTLPPPFIRVAHIAKTEKTENPDFARQEVESKSCDSTENSPEMERSRRELFRTYFEIL